MKQSLIAGLFIRNGFFQQHVDVCPTLFPGGHCLNIRRISGFLQNDLYQLMNRRIRRQASEPSISLQKRVRFYPQRVLFTGILRKIFQRQKVKMFLSKRAYPRQLLPVHASDRRRQHCCRRNILQRIIQHRQHTQNRPYLQSTKISGSGRRVRRNARFCQHL